MKPFQKKNSFKSGTSRDKNTSTGVRKDKNASTKLIKKVQTSNNDRLPIISKKPPTINSKVKPYARDRLQKNRKSNGSNWGGISSYLLLQICSFSCKGVLDVFRMAQVCKIWRSHITGVEGEFYWKEMKGAEGIENYEEVKKFLRKFLLEEQEKMAVQFEKKFTKLFNYGSTKQNVANKLIQKLDLQINVKINSKNVNKHPYKLRTFNFSSYLCLKVETIKEFKYDFDTPHNLFKDNLYFTINFRSLKYKVSHLLEKKYCPEEVVEMAIKQKAFNYYLDKNVVLTYFEGDNHFLYLFFQISALELVNIFRQLIKTKHEGILAKRKKKVPMYKQLAETQFQNFVQYIKYQADFEMHFSYHNSLKQIFHFSDTKVYPLEYDQKHAYFDIKVNDSFDKIATFKLDNKMGMSESVKDLYLLDLVLKDRDRFIIIFSGFIYGRMSTLQERQSMENYFELKQNEIKVLEFKGKKYDFKIMVVEEGKRNFMKNVQVNIYP